MPQARGLISAAERARSPVILQMLPRTLAWGGKLFLQYCLALAAHSAMVPAAVHLDHARDAKDINFALDLAEDGVKFDSIMIDASEAQVTSFSSPSVLPVLTTVKTDEENISRAKPFIERAHRLGIPVEVELGRVSGSEQGIGEVPVGALINASKAEHFMDATGADILAPSIGNIHGRYTSPPKFHLEILKNLQIKFKGTIPLCLHGTGDLPPDLFRACIANGVSKVNLNLQTREVYTKVLGDAITTAPLPDAIEKSEGAFSKACEEFFTILGSAGKANLERN
ncbi:fructose-bisphosphate aldolase [Coprinopsis cinerea AmutBmut pab1-1]|nr:fructose-bisphosphate aldolase [Coprinopsis cinerea AmutBmut pab1-1]